MVVVLYKGKKNGSLRIKMLKEELEVLMNIPLSEKEALIQSLRDSIKYYNFQIIKTRKIIKKLRESVKENQ